MRPLVEPLLVNALNLIQVPVSINNQEVKAVLDTGSTRNIISSTCVNRMKIITKQCEDPVVLRVVNGDLVYPEDQADLDLRVAGKTHEASALVINNFAYDLLLGLNFIKQMGAEINFKTHTLTINGHQLPLPDLEEKPARKFKIKETTWVPAHSEKIINVNGDSRDEMLLLEPVDALYEKKSLVGAKTLCTIKKGLGTLRVANLSNRKIMIPKDMIVAHGYEIQDIMNAEEVRTTTHDINWEDLMGKQLKHPDKEKLINVLMKYPEVMSKGEFDLGKNRHRKAQH